jgi:hypothetical protein
MKRISIYAAALVLAFSISTWATIINVPDDYATIQEGLQAASFSDTVLVQPGTYDENLYMGDVTLASLFLLTRNEDYISSTIIDGSVSFGIGSESGLITGFTIQNSSEYGIFCLDAGPAITNNIIRNNTWGGIYCANWYPGPVIRQNIIYGNTSDQGSAIYCIYYSNATIENNLIYGNHSTENGGAISIVFYSGGTLNNNTIYGNSTDGYGGGLYCSGSSPTISSSVFWANAAGNNGADIYVENGSPYFDFCHVQEWGDPDPLFRDPDNADFHLMSTECGHELDSPCIDAGQWEDYVLDCDWGLGTWLGDIGAYGGAAIPTDIEDNRDLFLPTIIEFHQNFPNPFNAKTIIEYSLPRSGEITVSVYDLLGRRISTIFDGMQDPGEHTILWDAGDLPSGIYFGRLQAGAQNKSIKMVLLR